jgi:hypothetical protein
MKAICTGTALVALITSQSSVSALTPASASDGPVRLLSCVVSSNGKLEAEVDNQSDDAQYCNVRCNFDLGGQTFSHWFAVTIPKRFNGRVGEFDTNGGKPGSFSGDVGTCTKTSTH